MNLLYLKIQTLRLGKDKVILCPEQLNFGNKMRIYFIFQQTSVLFCGYFRLYLFWLQLFVVISQV